MCTIIYVDQTGSTNSLLAASAKQFEHGTALVAHVQTSGRGQRGNSWEAEAGMNLTFSLLLKPHTIVAARQFELSQIVSISIVKVLRRLLGSDDVRIKWPNDIYYRDRKLAGILIENTLSGVNIEQTIVGIGLNVNQKDFRSNAPNPISMTNITGKTYDLDAILDEIVRAQVKDFDEYEADPTPTNLAAKYRNMMWRNEGFWPYRDNITGQEFEARIAAVAPTGHITLALKSGSFRTYAFKELTAVL